MESFPIHHSFNMEGFGHFTFMQNRQTFMSNSFRMNSARDGVSVDLCNTFCEIKFHYLGAFV